MSSDAYEFSRKDAYEALILWFQEGSFLQEQSLPPFELKLVLGVCRHHLFLEYIVKKWTQKKPILQVQVILEMGLYQLMYMDSVPKHAAVDTSVDLVHFFQLGKGNAALVNAILRNFDAEKLPPLPPQKVKQISIQYSVPEWIVRRWFDSYGKEQAEVLAKESLEEPIQWIRVDLSKTSLEKIQSHFDFKGKEYQGRFLQIPARYSIKKLIDSKEFQSGHFSFQNPAALEVVQQLALTGTERVWDACAAPGGKSALLLEMYPDISLVASDASSHRIQKMEDLKNRKGHRSLEVSVLDATAEVPPDLFDAILLDVPCSNFGVLSRRPEVVYRTSPETFKLLAEKQLKILENASRALKMNGVLVYATCSQESVETTGVIKSFLKKHPEYKIYAPALHVGGTDGLDRFFVQSLTKASECPISSNNSLRKT
ncbi:MAG: methyltransferase domain-containing protein [Fibrobacter sp.]|nr:methyltransferase domain-containing protein [Fibrobacter sp.]